MVSPFRKEFLDAWGGLPAELQPWEELSDLPDALAVRAEVAYNYGARLKNH